MALIMTVKQVAAYFQLSISTIYRLTRSGALPAKKIKGRWLYEKHKVDIAFDEGLDAFMAAEVYKRKTVKPSFH